MDSWSAYEVGYEIGWGGQEMPHEVSVPLLNGYEAGMYDHEHQCPHGTGCFPPMDEHFALGWG